MTSPNQTGTMPVLTPEQQAAVDAALKKMRSDGGKARWRKFNREARAAGLSPKEARSKHCGEIRRVGHAVAKARAQSQ